jgi:hypothetical protein
MQRLSSGRFKRGRWLGSGPNRSKQDQAMPNKTKQNCLGLLGLIWPNRDFSMGCSGKNKKNPLCFRFAWGASQDRWTRRARTVIARILIFARNCTGKIVRPCLRPGARDSVDQAPKGEGNAPLIATTGFLRFIPRGAPQVGPVAQWSEPAAHNGLVAGSSPARPTKVLIASFPRFW